MKRDWDTIRSLLLREPLPDTAKVMYHRQLCRDAGYFAGDLNRNEDEPNSAKGSQLTPRGRTMLAWMADDTLWGRIKYLHMLHHVGMTEDSITRFGRHLGGSADA